MTARAITMYQSNRTTVSGPSGDQLPVQAGTRDELKGAPLLALRNTPFRSMSKNTEPSGLRDAFNPHRTQ